MSGWWLGLAIPLHLDSDILFILWEDPVPPEDPLKRKAHPLCDPNTAFILSIRKPLHPPQFQGVKAPMKQKAYRIGGYVGPLEGRMNEEMANFSREPGWYSVEYSSIACKLTFSPSRLRRGRFGKVENGPMHYGGISSEETLLGQEKVLKRRPGAVGQVCESPRCISEKVEKWLRKDGGLWPCFRGIASERIAISLRRKVQV